MDAIGDGVRVDMKARRSFVRLRFSSRYTVSASAARRATSSVPASGPSILVHERGGEVIVDGSHRRDCVIEVEDRPGKVRIGSDPTRVSGFDMCASEALDSATGLTHADFHAR